MNRVDLIRGVYETVAALLMEEWKNDMDDEIDAINHILPNTPASSGFVKGWIQEKRHELYKLGFGQLSARSFTTNQSNAAI